MELIDDIATLRGRLDQWRRGDGRVGLVPTLGALHAGHAAHIETLRPRVDALVVSVFLNPTQFAPGEDLDRYPSNLVGDIAVAEAAGADVVFAPPASAMYPLAPSVFVTTEGLGHVLEGASRPTHFRGVTTVVAKLLNITAPDWVTFGQKDAQQVVVVRRMMTELMFPTRILVIPTVREPDGLAMSSRNVYLTPEERRAAPVLHRALGEAAALIRAGERRPEAVRDALTRSIAAEPLAWLDYAAVVDVETLDTPARLTGRTLLAVAARFGAARLIDNVCLDIGGDRVEPALP